MRLQETKEQCEVERAKTKGRLPMLCRRAQGKSAAQTSESGDRFLCVDRIPRDSYSTQEEHAGSYRPLRRLQDVSRMTRGHLNTAAARTTSREIRFPPGRNWRRVPQVHHPRPPLLGCRSSAILRSAATSQTIRFRKPFPRIRNFSRFERLILGP